MGSEEWEMSFKVSFIAAVEVFSLFLNIDSDEADVTHTHTRDTRRGIHLYV